MLAYVSQVAWVMNATLKANIHFTSHPTEQQYQQVINCCALEADIEMLPAGDSTEIGERGINLSGGQKQRVSLARAVLSDADIYLLDDPLSAVDVHVGKHLFEKVIGNSGVLQKKMRVLVTHGVNWLPYCDRVLFISPESEATGCASRFEVGTYRELLAANGPFARFMQAISSEQIESESQADNNFLAANSMDRLSRQVSAQSSSDSRRGTLMRLTSQESVASKGSSAPLKHEDERRFRRKEKEKLIQVEKVHQGTVSSTFFSYIHTYNNILKFFNCGILGAVHPRMYMWYLKSQGYPLAFLWFGFLLVFEGLQIYGSFWLTFWTDDARIRSRADATEKGTETENKGQATAPTALVSSLSSRPTTLAAFSLSSTSTTLPTWNATSAHNSTSSAQLSIFAVHLYYMGVVWLILLVRAAVFVAHAIVLLVALLRSARNIHSVLLGAPRSCIYI